MANTNVAKIQIVGDTRSIEKSLINTAKRLEYTRTKAKQTSKEVGGLGKNFTQAANNVAIFNGQLDPISGRLSAIGSGITRFGVASVGLTAIIGGLTLGISKSVSALETYEKRQNKFQAVLTATGHASRLTRGELEQLAQTTARNTLGNVDEMSNAIVALTTFRNVQSEVFKQTIALASDARVAFGGNLREGVIAFGKALNDPLANLGALSRKGIQFADSQEVMIEKLVESGDLLAAQNIIMGELQDQFGSLATKEAPALESQMDSLSQSIGNMFEGLGRTDEMKGFRDVLTQIARGADKTAQSIADIHSERNIEANNLKELEETQTTAYANMIKWQTEYNQLVESGADNYTLKRIAPDLNEATTAYQEATTALRLFVDTKKLNAKQDELDASKGFSRTLVGELSQVDDQTKKLQQRMEQRKVALISGFEDEKDKANRVFTEKLTNYAKSYEDQLAITQRAEEKQLAVIDQGVKNRNLELERDLIKINYTHNKKIQGMTNLTEVMRLDAENQAKIEKLRLEVSQANADAELEKDKVRNENAKKRVENGQELVEIQIKAEEAKEAKLVDIDRKRAARAEAEANRERRALEIARNAARQREKFLNEISSGSNKKAELKFKYEDDVEKLATAEYDKTELAAQGVKSRAELVAKYVQKLKENYDQDVKNFEQSEASKQERKLEQAAKASGRDFLNANQDSQLGLDKQDTGIESFFGVDINGQAEQFAALEQIKSEHLAKIDEMEVSQLEKKARRDEVATQFGIQQAEISAEGRAKAESDVWSAIGTLGANGSKKAFKIAKALNIAQAGMNTYVAVTNALANIPTPFNYVAAGLIGVAGAIEINKIRTQQPPQFHDGIDSVPREGTYLLDKGERVLDSRLNQDLKESLRNGNGTGGSGDSPTINFKVDATDASGFDNWYANNRQSIINDIAYGMERR